ncbi:MAG: tetratricopeptide repeat protein [Deltaproteobacteria bacterium]|nr:tetratricopeptide repeat protein [Deltaproteobacteria bacterium]
MLIKDNKYKKNLNRLLRTVASGLFEFIILRYNITELFNEAVTSLKNAYPNRECKIFSAKDMDYNLFMEKAREAESGFLIIEDFEHLLDKQDIYDINYRRDLIAQKDIALIVCIPAEDEHLLKLMKKMPDFWSFQSLTIKLTAQISKTESKQDNFASELKENRKTSSFTSLTISAKLAELKRLEKRIKEPEAQKSFNLLSSLYSQIFTLAEELAEYKKGLEYANKYLQIAKAANNPSEISKALNKAGEFNIYLGNYSKGLKLCEKALKSDIENLGNEHPNTAVSLNNIGGALQYLGEYKRAVEHYEKALDIDKKVYGEEHPNVAIRLSNIGGSLQYLGEYKRAIEHYEQALDIDKKVYGEEHPKVATSLNNIGGALQSLGEYKKAIRYYKQAFDIDKKVYGEEHPKVATSLNNIGGALQSLGEYKKAIEHYEQALDIDKKVYGEEHPKVAIRLNNIGVALQYLGKYKEALGYCEKALKIRMRLLGENHPDTKNVKVGIGIIKQKLNN